MPRRTGVVGSAVALLAAVGAGACSPRASDRGRADAARDSSRGSAVAAADTHVITVVAKDFSFDAPTQIPGGVTAVRLLNQGHELHHVVFIRLDDGKTPADLVAAITKPGPPPAWAKAAGGPNGTVPGGTSDATLILEPGNYVLLCFLQGTDNVPHMAKGMVRPLTVTASNGASGSAASEPTADIKLGLTEYSFAFAPVPTSGGHTIRVDNNGKQDHEIVLVRLPPGKTVADLMAWLDKPAGPPPAELLGGVSPIAPGRHAYFTADLTPGSYAAMCFVGDAADGKPHIAHGMIKPFTVT
jgi:hypothetical protein